LLWPKSRKKIVVKTWLVNIGAVVIRHVLP
jgi:hypothetical protein